MPSIDFRQVARAFPAGIEAAEIYMGGVLAWPASNPAFVDEFPGSAAAWSLRSLSSTVLNVVRVRRSSDGQEGDFTAAEVANGDLVAWTGAGEGFVRTLYDQSGNGHHAVQTDPANQPTIVQGGALILTSGRPAISCDRPGGNGVLNIPSSLYGFSQEAVKTIVSIARFSRINGDAQRVYFWGDGPSSKVTLRVHQGKFDFVMNGFANELSGSATKSSGQTLFWSEDLGGAQRAYVDGAFFGSSGGGGVNVTNNARIGNNAGGNSLSGTVSEMVLFTSDQTANRSALQANIAAHYSLTLA